MGEWQPIETAPKDVFVLVTMDAWAGGMAITKIREDGRFELTNGRTYFYPARTQWMPLPPLPNTSAVEKLMGLADNYADCRGAEDCGADPVNTEIARCDLYAALVQFAKQIPQKIPQNDVL